MKAIQSISDIITNSSSEVFCVIISPSKILDIKEALSQHITNVDSDDMSVRMEYYSNEENDGNGEKIVVSVPMCYEMESTYSLMRVGIDKIVSDAVDSNEYKIEWNEDL